MDRLKVRGYAHEESDALHTFIDIQLLKAIAKGLMKLVTLENKEISLKLILCSMIFTFPIEVERMERGSAQGSSENEGHNEVLLRVLVPRENVDEFMAVIRLLRNYSIDELIKSEIHKVVNELGRECEGGGKDASPSD